MSRNSNRPAQRLNPRRLSLGIERLERRECRASDIAPGFGQLESPFAAAWCFPEAPGGMVVGEAEPPPVPAVDPTMNVLTDGEVKILLDRAAAASASQDAIIAVLDRSGRILGVRVEQDVADRFAGDIHKMVFAIDGAVAVARTAAQFAHNQAPLTSRTIRNLSLSDVTEREVESNPTLPNPLDGTNNNPWDNSQAVAKTYGPGFVAPIGVNGHFPQGISFTPPVDLFGIERQSRDSMVHPGADDLKGTADDIALAGRFNIPLSAFAPGKSLFAPESYGVVSGLLPYGQGRGFGTIPGGLPIYKFVQDKATGKFAPFPEMVGGIGVFFPGPDGYATHAQNFEPALTRPGGEAQSDYERTNAPLLLEAEWMAFAAVGGIRVFNPSTRLGDGSVGTLSGIPALANFGLPFGRIDLAGITLEVYGPNPTQQVPRAGLETLLLKGQSVGREVVDDGFEDGVNALVDPLAPNPYLRFGIAPPDGWIVPPRVSPDGSSDLTVADIEKIVLDGVAKAEQTRAAIRLDLGNVVNGFPQPGARTRMVLAVGDRSGNILGLYRMPDATMFSIDVAVAKARNTAYYANPDLLQDLDKVDDDLLVAAHQASVDELLQSNAFLDGMNNHESDLFGDSGGKVPAAPPAGSAFSNRTFRFLAEPHYPSGIEEVVPPVFSSLVTLGVNQETGENESLAPALIPNAADFSTVFGWTAFRNGRNFRNPANLANQNGVVYFPGSTPLYRGNTLIGGFGVSGDGVDQDDVVTFAGQGAFAPPAALKADAVFYRGVRLPFQKFNRNPLG